MGFLKRKAQGASTLKKKRGKTVDPLLALITKAAIVPAIGRALPQPLSYPWSIQRLQVQNLPTDGSNCSPNPLPRYGHSISSHPSAPGVAYLFGGLVECTTLCNDLFLIFCGGKDNAQLSANIVPTRGDVPLPRVGHTSVIVRDWLIIWGGDTGDTNDLDDGIYVLDTETNTWSEAATFGPRPPPRYGHTTNVIDNTKVMVFGGQAESTFFNDIWIADFASHMVIWNSIVLERGSTPDPRTGHVALTYEDKIYIFGGTDGQYRYNDVWCFDTHTWQWSEIRATGLVPAPREGHAASMIEDVIYVFGGRGTNGKDLDDLSAFRISDNKWFAFQDIGPEAPDGRSGHAMMGVDFRIYLLGGEGFEGSLEVEKDEDTIHVLQTDLQL